MMESYESNIKRVIDIRNGWAQVQMVDRRVRYLNTNRVDKALIEEYNVRTREEQTWHKKG
jgi:hypothetical protein